MAGSRSGFLALRWMLLVALMLQPALGLANVGARIYREGVLPSGQPLRGERAGGLSIQGEAAACVLCHRRSGLGSAEGRIVIPPITAKYLFNAGAGPGGHVSRRSAARPAYDEASLARAITEGLRPDGSRLNPLMPRYKLDASALSVLIGYLKTLSIGPARGVTDDTLHFATIITPDADPLKKQAMLAVLEKFFADKNAFVRGGQRRMQLGSGIEFRVQRRWQLHVWELTGPESAWEAQLRQRLRSEPVLAAISGLGGVDWTPVHRFCEQESLPCLFPNVDLPIVAESDFYPVYFSKGMLLEAQLILDRLRKDPMDRHRGRVVQLFRAGGLGQAAAAALSGSANDVAIVDRPIEADAPEPSLSAYINELAKGDVLVLWLNQADLGALPERPPEGVTVYASGLMGGLERTPLPSAWRPSTSMTYPFDLPERRRLRMNYPLGWFRIKQIPVTDERLQSNTYLACGILAETLTDMMDSLFGDYLVERTEMMVSKRPPLNAYYPRLGLGVGQRFASKGGYLVRFVDPAGTALMALGEWTVP